MKKLLKQLIIEEIIRGRALDRYATMARDRDWET